MLDLIVNPFITILLLFYGLLGNVFLAIVAFTVVIRMALVPLTLKQQRSMKAMQDIQPELKKLQETYKNDRETLVQKQMELYREYKVNPMAGCLPLFIQIPIFLGLWRAIVATLALSPSDLLSLSNRILIPGLDALVPMDHQFLWLNLAVPDPYLILPVLVLVTSWLQQKLIMPPMPKKKPGERSDDPSDQAAQMTRQMTTIMPIMFFFITLTYASGVAIYILISNLIGIIQYAAMGKADFRRLIGAAPAPTDEELMEITDDHGRRRKTGISDTWFDESKSKTAADSIPQTEEKRSTRVARAKKASQTRLKAK